MKLKIAWLYPSLMGTYGDRGNIITLIKRCQWRNIQVEVREVNPGSPVDGLRSSDLIFMGGAQDRQQKIVADDILKNKGPIILELIEKGAVGLFVCASYQFLGHFYRAADGEEIPGLGLFDLYTVNPGPNVKRCIGNIVVELDLKALSLLNTNYQPFDSSSTSLTAGAQGRLPTTLVGFENHGGRTYLGEKVNPLGRVLKGFGNNGQDKTEGAVYKNAIGCYFHGPLLPRNPHLADYLIAKALRIDMTELYPLDDALELRAHAQALRF